VTPIILRTDPQGFFFYWTDQNKVREKVPAPEWFFLFTVVWAGVRRLGMPVLARHMFFCSSGE